MKKSGFMLSLLAFGLAIAAAAAPVDFFTNSTKYPNGGPCSIAYQTVEANCLTTNHGNQCHVFVSSTDQSRLAFDDITCQTALKMP